MTERIDPATFHQELQAVAAEPAPKPEEAPAEQAAAPIEQEAVESAPEPAQFLSDGTPVDKPVPYKVFKERTEKLAEENERLRLLTEEFLRRQVAEEPQETKPAAPEITRPVDAIDTETLDYVDQRMAALEEQVKNGVSTANEELARLKQEAEHERTVQTVAKQYQDFVAKAPDYPDAYVHVLNTMGMTYYERALALGHPPEQAKALAANAVITEVENEARVMIKAGKSAPEVYYERAKRLGYTPKQSKGPNMDAIEKNQRKSSSLNASPNASLSVSKMPTADLIREMQTITATGRRGRVDPKAFRATL